MTFRKKSLNSLVLSLMAYWGLAPLFLLPAAAFWADGLDTAGLIPLTAILLSLPAGLAAGKVRRFLLGLVMALQTLLWGFMLYRQNTLMLLLLLPAYALMALLVKALAQPLTTALPTAYLTRGLALHLMGQFLVRSAAFAPAASRLSLWFSLYLIGCLFMFNRHTLDDISGAQAPPKKLVTGNRRGIFLFSILALTLSNLNVVAGWFDALWALIKRIIAAIILFIMRLFPSAPSNMTQETSRGEPDLFGLGEASEPSLLAQILEKIVMVLAILIAAAALIFALYHLFKRLRRLVRRLLDRLAAYSRAIGEDYQDQTESLLDIGLMVENALTKWRGRERRAKPAKWEALSPGGKVRRAYALWLGRAKKTEASLTARETLERNQEALPTGKAPEIAALYEKARYSPHPVSPEEAETMRRDMNV